LLKEPIPNLMILRHKDFKVLVAGYYPIKELKKYLKQLGLEVELSLTEKVEGKLCREMKIIIPNSDQTLIFTSGMEVMETNKVTSFHYNIPHNIARIVKTVIHPFFGVKSYKLDAVLYTPTIEEVIFYSKHRLEREGKIISIKVDAV
jgi:hypothetical protein